MIKFIRDKYYWYNICILLKYLFSSKKESKILIFGYQKSGDTWLRFLPYNYLNLLCNPEVKEVITYDTLSTFQNNVMERGGTFLSEEGFLEFNNSYPNLIEK